MRLENIERYSPRWIIRFVREIHAVDVFRVEKHARVPPVWLRRVCKKFIRRCPFSNKKSLRSSFDRPQSKNVPTLKNNTHNYVERFCFHRNISFKNVRATYARSNPKGAVVFYGLSKRPVGHNCKTTKSPIGILTTTVCRRRIQNFFWNGCLMT